MKSLKAIIVSLVVVLGIGASAETWAHRGGARFGFFIGGPAYYPGYYPPSYYPPYYYPPYDPYYYPRTVVVPAAPPVYVEQNPPPSAAPAPSSYWYYCADSGAYYPNVSECASPWQRVSPRPPS
jgi:hypothetical protein